MYEDIPGEHAIYEKAGSCVQNLSIEVLESRGA